MSSPPETIIHPASGVPDGSGSHAGGRTALPWVGRGTLWLVLVFLVTFVAYFGVWQNGFVYDSATLVEGNERVHGLDRLGEIFQTEYWNLSGVESRLYRPVTLASYALQWGPSAGDPGPFHWTNLLLHLLVVALLWRLLVLALGAKTTGSPAGLSALFGATFFALTPVHSEAVITVVGRADLFVAVALLSVLLVLRAAERNARLYPVALVLSGFAVLSKESGFLVPAWVLAAHVGGFLRGRTSSGRVAWLPNLAWTGGGLALAWALRFQALRDVASPVVYVDDNVLAESGFLERVFNASRFFWRYLELHLRPDKLSADHGLRALEAIETGAPANVLAALALIAIGTWLMWRAVRRVQLNESKSGCAPLWLGAALYVGTLVASGNFFFLIGTTFGERLTYLPHIGLALVLGATMRLLLARLPKQDRTVTQDRTVKQDRTANRDRELPDTDGLSRNEPPMPAGRVSAVGLAVFALAVLLVLVSANATRARVEDWRSEETLFAAAVRAQPQSFRAWALHGNALLQSGDVDSSRTALSRSTELFDRYPQAWVDLVALEYNAGNFEVAADHASRLREVVPNHVYGYLATAAFAMRQGDLQRARAEIELGCERHPTSFQLAELAGQIGLQSQDWEFAQQGFLAALELAPRSRTSWRGLAAASLGSGDWDEAVRAYSSWADFEPSWEPVNGWAWSLYQRASRDPEAARDRDLERAEELSRGALQAVPEGYWRYVAETLSHVLEAQGKNAEAREVLEELVRRHPEETSFGDRLRRLE